MTFVYVDCGVGLFQLFGEWLGSMVEGFELVDFGVDDGGVNCIGMNLV